MVYLAYANASACIAACRFAFVVGCSSCAAWAAPPEVSTSAATVAPSTVLHLRISNPPPLPTDASLRRSRVYTLRRRPDRGLVHSVAESSTPAGNECRKPRGSQARLPARPAEGVDDRRRDGAPDLSLIHI